MHDRSAFCRADSRGMMGDYRSCDQCLRVRRGTRMRRVPRVTICTLLHNFRRLDGERSALRLPSSAGLRRAFVAQAVLDLRRLRYSPSTLRHADVL